MSWSRNRNRNRKENIDFVVVLLLDIVVVIVVVLGLVIVVVFRGHFGSFLFLAWSPYDAAWVVRSSGVGSRGKPQQ